MARVQQVTELQVYVRLVRDEKEWELCQLIIVTRILFRGVVTFASSRLPICVALIQLDLINHKHVRKRKLAQP